MANNQIKTINNNFNPQYPLVYLSNEGAAEIPPESITVDKVGKKAFGLSCIPKCWTLPFIVVSSDLMVQFSTCKTSLEKEDLLKKWIPEIIKSALAVKINHKDEIIVRSSGYSEGLNERGTFYSSNGSLDDMVLPLKTCLHSLVTDTTLKKENIPLIIQKYAFPIPKKGHLSNERRCYKEKRDWLGQYEDTGAHFTINLRNWREEIDIDKNLKTPLVCNLSAHVLKVLKLPATWAYKKKIRLHFEWVWDGNAIHLVQADLEHEYGGIDPSIKLHPFNNQIKSFIPKCLKEITKDHAKKYAKINNVFIYKELGLPTTKLFIVDDQSMIKNFALDIFPPDLKEDLEELVKGSLVIRMDMDTNVIEKRQLLPRTHEVR